MPRRVVLLRGSMVNPWELRAWSGLGDDYEVDVLVPPRNKFERAELGIGIRQARTVGSLMPPGVPGALATKAIGDRYIGATKLLHGADIVHAAELGTWFSWQAARRKERLGFKLALTVWETLPFLDAYRNVRTRRYRREVLAATDLFLAATERAREALLLEGAAAERIVVHPPGIDVDRFAAGRHPEDHGDGDHLVLSVGRLVWEKGHQDVLRAIAVLRARGCESVRGLIIGTGPEEKRLRAVVADLGLEDRVEMRRSVPYDEMPLVFGAASCLVLASQSVWFWEEQFGMVLAEAMAAHVPVIAASSGAIPEVIGDDAELFSPGDWLGLAERLGPVVRGPRNARRPPDAARLARYSNEAAAQRLRQAYESLL